MALHSQRKEHNRSSLLEQDVDPDPIRQFMTWFDAAARGGVAESNAMALATADPDGRPSARIVLLRSVDDRGFVFFTNYLSRKGRELEANPHAALVFFWHELERQVRVEGPVERLASAESDAYFQSRPRGARIGAWASPQSEVVASRSDLDVRYQALEDRHTGEEVPRPANWGGYRVIPEAIEFWQGRPNRLHDRLRYTRRDRTAAWMLERLAP